MNEYEKIIYALSEKTVESVIEGFIVELNDNITNKVRDFLKDLSDNKIIEIQQFLYIVLNYCYNCKLFDSKTQKEEVDKINSLPEKDRFLLKQTIIYFLGRLPYPPDLKILKKAYNLDNNKYIKMNLTFSTLQTFDEEIEFDFIKKITTNNEYDKMIRSWSMAFLKNASNPYDYIDNSGDDWTYAKMPRINRFSINDKKNPKYEKSMAYRLIDLVIISLFIKNRGKNTLSKEEKEIIKNASIEYPKYSEKKKDMINEFKRFLIGDCPI